MILNARWLLVGWILGFAGLQTGAGPADPVREFILKYCSDCHDSEVSKGELNLIDLTFDPGASENFATWVKVHDRVVKREMPPEKKSRPDPADLSAFRNALASELQTADSARVAKEGRASNRRLNRYEYEETLRDLLALPYLEVKAFLPEDREAYGFNKIGDALDVSFVQMSRTLTAAEFALREAMAPQTEPPERKITRFYTWEQGEFFGKIDLEGPLVRRTFPLIGLELQRDVMAQKNRPMPHTTDPERRERESIAVVVSTYEPTEIRFGGFRAPVSGRYRLKFSAYSIWLSADFKQSSQAHRSEPVTIYAETPPRSLRKLGNFDVGPDPTVNELDVWLLSGETIRPDAARFFRSRPPNHKNPLAGPDGMPGLAFQWMEVDGPVFDQWPPSSHRLLFGNLPLINRPEAPQKNSRRRRMRPPPGVEVISQDPLKDAKSLLRDFMDHVYRSPVRDEEIERFLGVVRHALESGYNFTDAMIAAYTGVLSSPAFLYFEEDPGKLQDLALAERLSYFLWNSCPDEELLQLARLGTLHESDTLRRQTDRMLNDPRSRRFIDGFLDYWLDLRLIEGTSPDEELYPDYQLDDLLVESMIGETQLFFEEMVRNNLGTANLVNSEFAILNERLATHYGIAGVEGVGLKRVPLPGDSVRGGLLTQASVLKVTANGTSTSPVKRGAWIMTRLLGKRPPPPPPGVPAVEPDIRGAATIREQLAKHRSQETCNACHRHIDPAGFALESFDVMGAWRDRYRSVGEGDPVKGIGHNGNYFHFSLGPTVDPSGELPGGETFVDVRQLKHLLLEKDEDLARNLTRQLVIYATGAPIGFSDRAIIEKILARTQPDGYGVRNLIHEIVQSDLFLNK